MNVKYVEAMVMRASNPQISTGEAERAIERLRAELAKELTVDDSERQKRAETLDDLLDAIENAVGEIEIPEVEGLTLEQVGSLYTISEQLERGFWVADEVAIVNLSVLQSLIANQRTEEEKQREVA